MSQDLYDATTKTLGPGTHTLTVDLPREDMSCPTALGGAIPVAAGLLGSLGLAGFVMSRD